MEHRRSFRIPVPMTQFSKALLVIAASLMASRAAGPPVEHKTRFDPEMVPGIRGDGVTFPLSNSRQIVRASNGAWVITFDIPGRGLFLAFGPPGCREGSRFEPPVLAVGDEHDGLLAKGSKPVGASLAVAGNSAYFAWSDTKGVWLATLSLDKQTGTGSGESILRAGVPATLVAAGGILGDVAIDAENRPLIAWSNESGIFLSSGSGAAPEKVADAGSDPVIEMDSGGRVHLAYRHQRETPFFGRLAIDPRISYTVRDGHWNTPQIAAQGLSFLPSIALSRDTPVIAFQHEGMKHIGNASGRYLEDREGGGASIGYTALVKGAWRTGFISQAQEILVRAGSVADGSVGRLYPMVEQKWRPRMAVDKHGVPWVFWPDTTRRHTYFARWLGSRFSDPYECRGGYYAPSEHMTVEKHMPSESSEIGFAYAAAGRLFFGTVPVPDLSTDDPRHYRFLDMLEIAEVEGARQHLNQFTKYPQNPVMQHAEPGAWDDYGLSFPNVRFDRGKFTMEYSGHGSGGTAGAWQHGYAESRDGIQWTRPKLGLIEHNGSRENNIIPWVPNFIDLREPDANKRYKGVLVEGNWITNFKRPIAYSPDGIHWTYGEDTVNLTAVLEGGGPAFRDELDIPERRFKAVGRTISQNHRSLGMMWSPDLIHWYGDEAILDIDDPYGKPAMQWRGRNVAGRMLDPAGDKAGDQIYWGTVWIESGIYMCLYAPFRYDGGYQAALAMSRDGLNYVRIRNGDFILPRGPAGAWDSGFVAVGYGINVPLRMGEKMRVYYGGVTSHHGTDPWRASAAIGMAELPVDGWTYVSPELDAAESYVTTIPIRAARNGRPHLSIRAEVPAGSGSLKVAVLDADTDTPVPGYSPQDCRSMAGVNGTAVVSWRGSDTIRIAARKVRLRFYLAGATTRLYSFWFH
jgi:hypothetical protein